MNININSAWNKVLSLLKTEPSVTEIGYNTWFKPIIPVSVNNSIIELGVPADFLRGILQSRYSDLIRNAFKVVTRKDFEIKFVYPAISSESIKKTNAYKRDSTLQNGTDDGITNSLNPKYTFETFVTGNGSQLAHAAALAVSESPAKSYNPLFIYGSTGLGKTHLMHAIGNYVLRNNPNLNVLYVSIEKFTNELINSIKDDTSEDFRQKYRYIDVLMVDDIHFLAKKERTQEEFFHTFNTLYQASKQIIISSDRPPREISTLEERLRSRFEWGLQVDIQPPDLETRIAILRMKAQSEGIEIPNEVMHFIADRIASNIRELEGALNKVIAYTSLSNGDLTIENVAEVLKDILVLTKKQAIDSSSIIEAVSRYFDLTTEDFKSKKRSHEISFPRQLAMYLCRELASMSLPRIGNEFGGRDHTTVLHACEKIRGEILENAETHRTVEELKRTIVGN